MFRLTDTIKHLIIVNVIFYIGMLIVPSLYNWFALRFPKNDDFEVWQIITHMFMHSPLSVLHIFLNMLALWMFGTPLEQMWGRNKFLFFYISCGRGAVFIPWALDFFLIDTSLEILSNAGYEKEMVIASLKEGRYDGDWENIVGSFRLKSLFAYNTSSVGASGAIMGLLAAFGLNFPNAKLALIFFPVPIAAKYFIPIYLGYEIFAGISGGTSILGMNIAHFAHVGGAVTGGLIAWYWKKNQFKMR